MATCTRVRAHKHTQLSRRVSGQMGGTMLSHMHSCGLACFHLGSCSRLRRVQAPRRLSADSLIRTSEMRDLGDVRCVSCGLLRQTVPVGMRSCVQATTRSERIVGRGCPHCHGVSSAVHGGPNASVRVFRCPHASERVQGGCSLCAQRWVNNHTPAVWTPSRTRAAHTSARPHTHTSRHQHTHAQLHPHQHTNT